MSEPLPNDKEKASEPIAAPKSPVEPPYVHHEEEHLSFDYEALSLLALTFFFIMALVSTVIYSYSTIQADSYKGDAVQAQPFIKAAATWKPFALIFIILTVIAFAAGIVFHVLNSKKKKRPQPLTNKTIFVSLFFNVFRHQCVAKEIKSPIYFV